MLGLFLGEAISSKEGVSSQPLASTTTRSGGENDGQQLPAVQQEAINSIPPIQEASYPEIASVIPPSIIHTYNEMALGIKDGYYITSAMLETPEKIVAPPILDDSPSIEHMKKARIQIKWVWTDPRNEKWQQWEVIYPVTYHYKGKVVEQVVQRLFENNKPWPDRWTISKGSVHEEKESRK